MTPINYNPNAYRYKQIQVGKKVLVEQYFHDGFMHGEPVNGICKLWGVVQSIPNEHFCLVKVIEIHNNDSIISMRKDCQYQTCINFCKSSNYDFY